MKYGILESGYTGKITAFGFTDEEIGEFVQEESDHNKYMEELEKEWRASLPQDTARGFIEDGSLTEEESFEMRRQALYNQCEDSFKNYYEAKLKRNPNLEELASKKATAATRYHVHVFRPDYYDTSASQQEIDRANKNPISQFIQTNKMGFALCIFHSEQSPSLHITENMYYCFGCNEGGRTIDFIMKQRGLAFKDAVRFLCGI